MSLRQKCKTSFNIKMQERRLVNERELENFILLRVQGIEFLLENRVVKFKIAILTDFEWKSH